MDFRWDIILDYLPLLLKGTLLTIGLSIISILIGTVLGLFIALGKMSKKWFLTYPMSGFIHLFRGTPLLVQIFIIHFGVVPAVLGASNAIVAAILSLSLNSAAYIAEIFRAGVQSLDKGQSEAASSLGMTKVKVFRYVILPQVVKRMVPTFGNEFIVLIKDSSLVAMIAAPELMYWSNAMRGQYLRVWESYLTAAVIYLILTYSLTKLLAYIERKM